MHKFEQELLQWEMLTANKMSKDEIAADRKSFLFMLYHSIFLMSNVFIIWGRKSITAKLAIRQRHICIHSHCKTC